MNQRIILLAMRMPLFFTLVIGLTLTGCMGNNESYRGGAPFFANRSNSNSVSRGNSAINRFAMAMEGNRNGIRSLGTDTFLDDTAGKRDLVELSDNGEFHLNLVNVPIAQAARAVLGEALKMNYTIEPDVSGTVTLQTTRPMSERDLIEIFQTALELNGATLKLPNKNTATIVTTSGSAQRIGQIGSNLGPNARVVAVPLEFIGTTEMTRLLSPIAGSSIKISALKKRNILLISGGRDDINATIEAVNLFDVDILKGKSVGLFPLRAAEPEAVVTELNTIFETEEGGSLQNVVSFVPSTRLGAILVISSRSKYLTKAENWIRKLDKTAGGVRRRPVVYSLQNRSASELAPVLQDMIQNVTDESKGPALDSGSARVVGDDAKNAIIVWGNDTEQENFARLIRTLDTTPVQVLLEATIAEVTLNDELEFGLRWFFEQGNLRGTFSNNAAGAVGSTFPGLSFLFQGTSASVALNALNSVTDVQVVSTPSLMVVDNQEAMLQIGDEVPIATQQVRDTSDPNAPVVNTISFRNTGIILKVKPRVSSSGQVVLDIEQEVSSVQNTTTSGIDSPTISQRKIKTNVVVADGQTLALGGLIEEGRNRNNAKVPGAGDVPVLGALFRSRSDKTTRTELLVLITPKVISNGTDARLVTSELRKILAGSNNLVQNGISQSGTAHKIID